ncbi:hypothetical protein BC941DRAFT_155290 [Chlamydoabsidia padenii]|nr:hypothetical protein BC941DRAFT_155290 [Chlamydoabsidia padenii]
MERRKSALLDIINRDKVRDFNSSLFDEIQSTDGSDKKHKLARPTAQRLVDSLEKAGLIRLIKVMPNDMFGGNQPRTLVISFKLGESDQLVKDYLAKIRNGTMIPSGRSVSSGGSLKTVDTEVTRYGCSPHQYRVMPDRYWRYIAKRHGWIDSKWLRAKELHLFLVKLLLQWQGGGDALDSGKEWSFSLVTLIGAMPLDVFKKVIGIQHHDPIVEDFMETNQDPGMALCDMPDNIKHLLIPNTYQMRRRVQALLLILEKLELLQSLASTSNNITYTFHLVGTLRNYTLPDTPILAEKRFTTLDSVIDYWNELQYTCTCVYSTETDRGSLKMKNGDDALSTITLSRTWTSGDMITSSQKQQLDQHVDYSLGQVPTNDWSLYLQLSRTTGLLPYRIRSYYVNLRTAFAKRSTLGQQLVNEQILTGDNKPIDRSPKKRKRPLDNTIQLLLQAAKEKKVVATQVPSTNETFSVPTFVGSRSLRRKYIKNVDESTSRKKHWPTTSIKRAIQPFTPLEKSTFEYAVAIMRYRARHGKFYWGPITRVIPLKSIRQCASRLQNLIASSSASLDTIDTLQQKWARIYTRGIEKKEIVDERPWDTKNFDLVGYLAYFLSQLLLEDQSTPPIQPTMMLPSNANSIHLMYTVTPVSSLKSDIPQESNHRPVMSSPYTMNNTCTDDNKVLGTKSIAVANAIQVIKMIMVHPETTFDSRLAYNLLSQCRIEDVEEAYSNLKLSGMIVLSKHGDTRRVPGRKFRLSNR